MARRRELSLCSSQTPRPAYERSPGSCYFRAIVSLMISRIPALSLGILMACGGALAADLTEHYQSTADKLIDAALADTEGYNRLTYLCYRIGHRLSGSPGLEKAIAWSV